MTVAANDDHTNATKNNDDDNINNNDTDTTVNDDTAHSCCKLLEMKDNDNDHMKYQKSHKQLRDDLTDDQQKNGNTNHFSFPLVFC